MTTIYAPLNFDELRADILNFKGTGVAGTATAGTVTNIDYQVPEDRIITGAYMIAENHVSGDHIGFQVVDIDGLYAPAGTVLREFLITWYLVPGQIYQPKVDVPYPAKIYQGLYIRLMYTSTGGTNVALKVNYYMHKVLA